MFFKNYQMYFFVLVATGTVAACSANTWFACWLGLEVNLMSLIPLILSELNFKSTEAAIKYFLAQALASVLLISAGCTQASLTGSPSLEIFNSIIFLALAVKAGIAPFHLWFPQVMICLSWMKCAIILTWQKIAPFTLISCFFNKNMSLVLIASSALIGAAGGLNQTETKLLMTYSSISHSAWMMLVAAVSVNSWLMYFSVYTITSVPIMAFFLSAAVSKVNSINKTKTSLMNKILLSASVLSLGGLPPFLGFTAKMYALLTCISVFPLILISILIVSSLTSLFFYTKMFYNLTTGASNELGLSPSLMSEGTNMILPVSISSNLVASSMVLLI